MKPTQLVMSHEAKFTLSAKREAELTGKLNDKQAKRLLHIPDGQRRVFLEAWAGDRSLAKAIKAKCLDCCGYQRQEVEACTAEACPLWRYRPFQQRTEQQEEV